MGDFVIMNPNCVVQHDTRIMDYVSLYGSIHLAGNVSIGAHAEVGMGARVIQQKTIGEHAVLGAGSVVVTDIPANCTAVGVPAKVIKMIPPPTHTCDNGVVH